MTALDLRRAREAWMRENAGAKFPPDSELLSWWEARRPDRRVCPGHPPGAFDPMGEDVYCDGTCAQAEPAEPLGCQRVAVMVHGAGCAHRWPGTVYVEPLEAGRFVLDRDDGTCPECGGNAGMVMFGDHDG